MSQIKYFISILIVFFVVETEVYAQDDNVDIYKGMTWYLDKSVALDSARSQNKQVLLVWGRFTCGNTNWVKNRLSEPPLKSIIEEHYILWFSNSNIYYPNSPEVADYLSVLTGYITLPAICVIDTFDITVAHGLKTGPQSVEVLQEMLQGYVSNDFIFDKDSESNHVYVVGDNLVVKGETTNEIISIFTIMGSLVDKFTKSEYEMIRDLSAYPKGVLLVTGSSGWSRKVVIR